MLNNQSVLKILADAFTGGRFVVALVVLAAAFVGEPAAHVPWVVALVVVAWTGDLFDGWLARRSGQAGSSWIGNHDLAIDASLAVVSLVYLVRLGWLSPAVLALYLGTMTLLWLLLRSHWIWNGFNTGSHLIALGSISQVIPGVGQLMLAWIAVMAVLGRGRAAQMLREIRTAFLDRLRPARLRPAEAAQPSRPLSPNRS